MHQVNLQAQSELIHFSKVSIVPVIAKSDCLTQREIQNLKSRILNEIAGLLTDSKPLESFPILIVTLLSFTSLIVLIIGEIFMHSHACLWLSLGTLFLSEYLPGIFYELNVLQRMASASTACLTATVTRTRSTKSRYIARKLRKDDKRMGSQKDVKRINHQI